MLYFHPSYPYLLALNLSKSYFRVSFMVDSRSIHRIVAIVMPPVMGGEEHEDAHTHDLVMPGFRFHPTEEELIEFYLRRKVEGKHFNIELIASLDLYRYDPWELPGKFFIKTHRSPNKLSDIYIIYCFNLYNFNQLCISFVNTQVELNN